MQRHRVTLENSEGSTLPEDLLRLGYAVKYARRGERILAGSIVEKFVRGARGDLEPLTAGSTKPIAETRTHAGIVATERFRFELS